MANSRAVLVCVLAYFLICLTGAQDVSTCPKYVREGDDLQCTCVGLCSVDATVRPTWPGHADTSARLVVPNINRQQDGDQFVCQMECGGQTSTSTYTLQVAYGPGDNDTVIVGPSPFITFNGTQTLTLTCNATANPTPEYQWYGISCENGNTNRMCTYTPDITEDGKAVTCVVTNPPKTVQSDSYKFNLSYPPQTVPVISGYIENQMIKDGDKLMCTVSGGKPLVTEVIFYCLNPNISDAKDLVALQNVSSSLTIDITNATKDNMSCSCTATWSERSDWYPYKIEKTLQIEYYAEVEEFVLDSNNMTVLMVNESDQFNVTMKCVVYGRPAPTVTLRNEETKEVLLSITDEEAVYMMESVKCEHMGTYSCTADNSGSDKKNVTITVFCAPRLSESEAFSKISKCPDGISENGFDLAIAASPLPREDDVEVLQNGTQSEYFTINLTQRSAAVVVLHVKATHFKELPPVEYKLSISNSFGTFDECSFQPLVTGGPRSAQIGLIAGLVTLAVIAIVVLIIILIKCRCCRKAQKGNKLEENAKAEQLDGAVNPNVVDHHNGSDRGRDNDSGIEMEMNGRVSPPEMFDTSLHSKQAPRQSDGAGYASLNEFAPTKQQEGFLRKKSARTAAYEVTSITPSGQVNIKQAAPQPNAYQDPWDSKGKQLAEAPGGPPTSHHVGSKGDGHDTVSNTTNKTTITVTGPKGDVYSTVSKHGKGGNAHGSPDKAPGQEDAAASQGPPLSMTSHPLDTPGYATLAQMAPDQGNQGDVMSSSGDAAASGSPVQNTSSSGDGTDNFDHFQRDGHDPKSTSQGPDVQYSNIGNY